MSNPVPYWGSQGPPGPVAASVATPAALSAVAPPVAYPTGTMAYVQGPAASKGTWRLDVTSTSTPDGATIVASTGGGNWLLMPTQLQGGGVAAIGTTGGTTTLTAPQWQATAIETSGVLASNATLIVPATPGLSWQWDNLCTGAFTSTIKSATDTGSGVTVAESHTAIVRVNAAGNVVRVTADT